MSVSGTGSRVRGTPYTLTCRVTLPSGVDVERDSLDIQWLKSNTSFTPPKVYINGSYTVILTFTLQKPNKGNYTCRANYSLSIFPSPVVLSNVSTPSVIPRCKYNYFQLVLKCSICLMSFSAYFSVRVSIKEKVENGSNDLFCHVNINFEEEMVDFQIVVNITWRYPSGSNYSDKQIVTQEPSSKRSYLTPDDEGDYTCTAQMFVDEVLIKKTEDIYKFIQRKITFSIS